jgi:hypothetical protein
MPLITKLFPNRTERAPEPVNWSVIIYASDYQTIFARGSLLASQNNPRPSHPCSSKYTLSGWWVSTIKHLCHLCRQTTIHTGSTRDNALRDLTFVKLIVVLCVWEGPSCCAVTKLYTVLHSVYTQLYFGTVIFIYTLTSCYGNMFRP